MLSSYELTNLTSKELYEKLQLLVNDELLETIKSEAEETWKEDVAEKIQDIRTVTDALERRLLGEEI
ncbi:hypothetical protein G112A_00422 [Candidatus Nanosynsacchari sp. TM7_G1_3_12Alb]|nr:hypothetical protein G112A_00422 [Candidatus Nanosynsacchari sp. TM7_G1_3_12Alb]